MTEDIKKLKDDISHLRACKEFESNLQMEIIKVGSKYMNVRDGETYSVQQAWNAIQGYLSQAIPPEVIEQVYVALELIAENNMLSATTDCFGNKQVQYDKDGLLAKQALEKLEPLIENKNTEALEALDRLVLGAYPDDDMTDFYVDQQTIREALEKLEPYRGKS